MSDWGTPTISRVMALRGDDAGRLGEVVDAARLATRKDLLAWAAAYLLLTVSAGLLVAVAPHLGTGRRTATIATMLVLYGAALALILVQKAVPRSTILHAVLLLMPAVFGLAFVSWLMHRFAVHSLHQVPLVLVTLVGLALTALTLARARRAPTVLPSVVMPEDLADLAVLASLYSVSCAKPARVAEAVQLSTHDVMLAHEALRALDLVGGVGSDPTRPWMIHLTSEGRQTYAILRTALDNRSHLPDDEPETAEEERLSRAVDETEIVHEPDDAGLPEGRRPHRSG